MLRSLSRRAGAPRRIALGLLAAALVLITVGQPAFAESSTPVQASAVSGPVGRISASNALNGGVLVANMHGFLFHPLDSDLAEDVAYARWLGSGVIRVFATDNNAFRPWDGRRLGSRIADMAPALRAARVQLIVALVNNHRAVPGELPGSSGWLDQYLQLLLPFYTTNWRGAYLTFVRDLISEVQARNATDVIYAWELGNELHTPQSPAAVMPFITQAVAEIRALDRDTPILPGTMGANHVEPGQQGSSIARWLYCEAPIDAYTLHAYDWVSPERPGDMPIHWDLDGITAEPCPNGRQLPVIIEELGTSRGLAGLYGAQDERRRLEQEFRQIAFVRRYPRVVGFGVWNAESPRLIDRTFVDIRRGLTSYGTDAQGGGSCYDPKPDTRPGVRCELERALRLLAYARPDDAAAWLPTADALDQDPLAGGLDPVIAGDAVGLRISGWIDLAEVDEAVQDPVGRPTDLSVMLGAPGGGGRVLALGTLLQNVPPAPAQFTLQVPLDGVPAGLNTLSVVARSTEGDSWFRTLHLVLPLLGEIGPSQVALAPMPAAPPVVVARPPKLDVAAPATGARVSRSFVVEGSVTPRGTSDAVAVEIFLEPGRDSGGRIVGSALDGEVVAGQFRVVVTVPRGAHTLDVHARSTNGQETSVEIPVEAD